jgi:glycosyltransferase involved in cell wall biosynthesis
VNLSPRQAPAADADREAPVASVIIPSEEMRPNLERCLAAVSAQDLVEPHEILVVTNPAPQREAQLRAAFPQVRLVHCPPDSGPGGARNYGIEAARGEYLAFTDDDCLPPADWLRRLLEVCRRREGLPVTGWVDPADPGSALGRTVLLAERGIPRPRRPRLVPGASGGNMAVSRRLLMETGARFGDIYGAGEMVLLSRLPDRYRSVIMDPSVCVRHLRQDDLRGSLRRMYRLGRGSGQWRKRTAMRGSIFARHPWLIPALPAARLAVTGARSVAGGWRSALDFVRLMPIISLMMVWYAAGFAAGVRQAAREPGAS